MRAAAAALYRDQRRPTLTDRINLTIGVEAVIIALGQRGSCACPWRLGGIRYCGDHESAGDHEKMMLTIKVINKVRLKPIR